MIAGFSFFRPVFAVNRFSKDPCAGCFAYTPGTAKKKGMGQLIMAYRIFQCCCYMRLPDHCVKKLGPVFSCRNDEFFHKEDLQFRKRSGFHSGIVERPGYSAFKNSLSAKVVQIGKIPMWPYYEPRETHIIFTRIAKPP